MTQAQLMDIIDEASRQLGATSRSGFFDIARAALHQHESYGPTKAIIFVSEAAAIHASRLQSAAGKVAEIVNDFDHLRMTQEMIVPPAILVVATAAEVSKPDRLPGPVRFVLGTDVAPVQALFLVQDSSSDVTAKDLPQRPGSVYQVTATADELPQAIQDFLAERLDAAHKTASETSLQRIARYLQTIVADETKALELRRQLLQVDAAGGRKVGLGGSSDLTNRVRGVVQKNIIDTERSFKLKYDGLNRSKQGEFQIGISNLLGRLTTEQIRTVDRASKTETYETEVDPQFVDRFTQDLRKPMLQQMEDDVRFVEQIRKMTIDQINSVLASEGLKPIDQRNLHVADLQPQAVSDSHFFINRKYSGEVTKDGMMQYFIALRDYTGMIMVLVGILAPLTLIATAPDADPDSVLAIINKAGRAMKNFRAYITFITALLVAGMLIYGFVDLRRRIPLRRIEEREREVQRSRDALEQEARRMYSDGSRDWLAQLATYIRDLAASINAEVEQSLRTKGQHALEAMDALKRRTSIEQASVEARMKGVILLDRKLQSVVKN